MVTVSIFTLRDVICQVQQSYKIPFNSTSHTSPATDEDVKDIRDYLHDNKLQSYMPDREHNNQATPARDLLAEGAAYANTARAFKNFRRDTRKAMNLGTAHGETQTPSSVNPDADLEANYDLGEDMNISLDDLAMDEEEFPMGTDIADFVAMSQEVIDELSRYD